MTDSLTYNFKSRDASASKKTGDEYLEDQLNVDNVRFSYMRASLISFFS